MNIVLLRGLGREQAHWGQFIPELAKQIPGANLYCIDFPGCGALHQQAPLDSITQMTAFVRQTIKEQGISGPVHVIAISMGAMVALDWAQRFANDIAAMALINTSCGWHRWWWRMRPQALWSIFTALCAGQNQREANILWLVSNAPDAHKRHLKQWQHIQQTHPVSKKHLIKMLWVASQFKPLQLCEVPALIAISEHDRLVSAKASKQLAHHFNWPIICHNWAGHDLPLDDPKWLAKKLAEYLLSQPSFDRTHSKHCAYG